MKTAKDPRDPIRWLIALLSVICLAGCLTTSSPDDRDRSYADLAAQMNAPELRYTVRFEAEESGTLFCYIDAAWRRASPTERQRFALRLARDWAQLTGNPHALVAFGTGHGTFWAFAAAHNAINGDPYYSALADYQ